MDKSLVARNRRNRKSRDDSSSLCICLFKYNVGGEGRRSVMMSCLSCSDMKSGYTYILLLTHRLFWENSYTECYESKIILDWDSKLRVRALGERKINARAPLLAHHTPAVTQGLTASPNARTHSRAPTGDDCVLSEVGRGLAVVELIKTKQNSVLWLAGTKF